MSELGGRFTEPVMHQIMHDLAGRLGVPDGDARLLRLTNNAVFALPAAGLVVRIIRSRRLRERAHKVAGLGAWLAHMDAPTIRLADVAVSQPIEVGGLLATVWHYLPPSSPALTVADLGAVLREFHKLERPAVALPAPLRFTLTPNPPPRRPRAEAMCRFCVGVPPQRSGG